MLTRGAYLLHRTLHANHFQSSGEIHKIKQAFDETFIPGTFSIYGFREIVSLLLCCYLWRLLSNGDLNH